MPLSNSYQDGCMAIGCMAVETMVPSTVIGRKACPFCGIMYVFIAYCGGASKALSCLTAFQAVLAGGEDAIPANT